MYFAQAMVQKWQSAGVTTCFAQLRVQELWDFGVKIEELLNGYSMVQIEIIVSIPLHP